MSISFTNGRFFKGTIVSNSSLHSHRIYLRYLINISYIIRKNTKSTLREVCNTARNLPKTCQNLYLLFNSRICSRNSKHKNSNNNNKITVLCWNHKPQTVEIANLSWKKKIVSLFIKTSDNCIIPIHNLVPLISSASMKKINV